MRIVHSPGEGTKLWLSARDTTDWALRPGAVWPCSFLRGKRLFAEFEANGNLVDFVINGGKGEQDFPVDEFNAITSDFLRAFDPGHPGIRGGGE